MIPFILAALGGALIGSALKKKVYADGGYIANQYIGKSAEQVWDEWTIQQREHFLNDHSKFKSADWKDELDSPLTWNYVAKKYSYEDLPHIVKMALGEHIQEGEYAKGGSTSKVTADNLEGDILLEVKSPKGKAYVLDIKNNCFEFTEFISKTLTKKWFGNGWFGVDLVEIVDDNTIIISVKFPLGIIIDKYKFESFLENQCTKKWFGYGSFNINVKNNQEYAKGGLLDKAKAGLKKIEKVGKKVGHKVAVKSREYTHDAAVAISKGSAKVAKKLEGKKTTSKKKYAEGGTTKKPSNDHTKKLKEVMAHAKATRKEGEVWKMAVKRSWEEIG